MLILCVFAIAPSSRSPPRDLIVDSEDESLLSFAELSISERLHNPTRSPWLLLLLLSVLLMLVFLLRLIDWLPTALLSVKTAPLFLD